MKKSKLCKAIAMATTLGGLGAGVYVPNAGAVNLPANGLGQVLIFPYYTARDGWQTTLNIINTNEANFLAVRLRVMEGRNSRDVKDFTITLSPGDVFPAVIEKIPNVDGVRIRRAPNDTTCVTPISDGSGNPNDGFVLSEEAYSPPDNEDGGTYGMSRLYEGYVVAYVMGHAPANTGALAGALHNPAGNTNCEAIRGLYSKASLPTTAQLFGQPINALKGNYSFLNVGRGTAAGGNAVALANFVTILPAATENPALPVPPRPGCIGLFQNKFGAPVGTNTPWVPDNNAAVCSNILTAQEPFDFLEPSLNDAYPAQAVVFNNVPAAINPLGVVADVWPPAAPAAFGFLAVSEVLRAATVVNEWSTNPNLGVSTDWVVTHPTKGFFTDDRPAGSFQAAVTPTRFPNLPPVPGAPFAQRYNGQSCNQVGYRIWDRDEDRASPGPGGEVSSPNPPAPNLSLCYETNVIPFGESVFGSELVPQEIGQLDAARESLNKPYGWLRLDLFTDPQAAANATSLGGPGLPAIGFMIRQRVIPTDGISNNYSDAADHSFNRAQP